MLLSAVLFLLLLPLVPASFSPIQLRPNSAQLGILEYYIMAIRSPAPPPPEGPTSNNATGNVQTSSASHITNAGIDIDAWTVSALQSLSVSPIALGTGTPLSIPIDELATPKPPRKQKEQVVAFDGEPAEYAPRRPLSRRDSQKHREDLLKGKEGSRQRRRWENGTVVAPPKHSSSLFSCQWKPAVIADQSWPPLALNAKFRSSHACSQCAAS